MDKLNLLAERKQKLFDASKDIRNKIDLLIDEKSFVELDRYSFSKNEFYQEDAQGEGVITGFATINNVAVYIVAQNSNVLNGGISFANANKIVKCLDKALVSGAPVIYFLSSLGVLAGEGLKALEGAGLVLNKMQELKGEVPQFSIALGDVLGSSAIFSATCDFNFMLSDSCVSYASPFVLSAKGDKDYTKAMVGGVEACAKNGMTTFAIDGIADARNYIANILDVLPQYGGIMLETMDDLNRNAPNLNQKACANCLISAVFDKDYAIELGKGFASEVKTVIGRVGGYSVAAIIFDGEDGVQLNGANIEKIKKFIYFAMDNDLPLVNFINTCGIEQNPQVSNTTVMKSVSDLAYALYASVELPRINIIYGKAIGLGYTLFASRAFGANYSMAFANAKISAFEAEVGAQIEFGANGESLEKLTANYAENEQDAFNSALNGFVDNVIEPEFVRQYLISALQMLV